MPYSAILFSTNNQRKNKKISTMANEPILSVVVPMMNESGNVIPLMNEIANSLRGFSKVGENFEIICVDDGSTDSTAAEVKKIRSQIPQIRLIKHKKRMGMSPALRNGIRRARAGWIVTIDGDRQNDPADIPLLCNIAWEKCKNSGILVGGIRVKRQDTIAKRIASKFANMLRKFLLNDDCPDTGCSLKVFRRDDYLELPFFKGLHRFMPALFKLYGHKTVFVPVNDRPRIKGVTKSSYFGRAVKGFFDLLGVIWLIYRTPAPDRGREENG